MRERRVARRLQNNLERLQGYFHRVANRTGWKSILFGAEDIVQECTIVLWKVLAKYPDAKGSKLIKLFKRSLVRHLASIFRLEHVRRSMGTLHLSLLGGMKGGSQGPSDVQDNSSWEDLLQFKVEVVPWSFYKSKLKIIEKRIGKERLSAFLEDRHFGKSFEERKEVVLKNAE